MSVLQRIHGHKDLLTLNRQEQLCLCQEIRDFLVSHVAKTGGHLASNLGVVELSVAIETVFDTSKDRLIFDVGHQSYVHKLLTGRQEQFEGLRQFGGIAGFPKPGESDADAFVAGHASSSVSIALGMARAAALQGRKERVVALLGDGAATGGMAYEGLNDAAVSRLPMVIILNDNEMSIDRSVGGLSRHLNRMRTKDRYILMKRRYRRLMGKFPGGDTILRLTQRMKQVLKRTLLRPTIFENMGLEYLGPVDGHDVTELIRILKIAQSEEAPVLVHVMTRKGCGYKPAEEHPAKFHGIGKFDPVTGQLLSKAPMSFSEMFGKTMVTLAARDPRVCAITAAMPGGTGLLPFRETYPRRLFDVGIAEEHAVSMAGGLAKQGMIPVVAIYSTFLQRAYDQILQDVGLLNLHVVFAVDRAGLVGEDGETHHGLFDIGFLSQVPGMAILCPANLQELNDMLSWAVLECKGPVAVRYPRGGEPEEGSSQWDGKTKVVSLHSGNDLTLVTYGTLAYNALEAAKLLAEQGIHASVLRMLTADPKNAEEIFRLGGKKGPIVLLEEALDGSGICKALGWELRQQEPSRCVYAKCLGSHFVTHGSNRELYAHCGLDPAGIAAFCKEALSHES